MNAVPRPVTDGQDAYVLDDQVGFLLRRAHQRASAIFQAEFAASRLTPMQWAALVQLADHGALSQNHLGRLTAMDPATIQGVIRRLVRRGLIERRADAVDRRRKVLEPTPEGRVLTETLRPRGHAVSARVLSPLSGRERRQLLELLVKIG